MHEQLTLVSLYTVNVTMAAVLSTDTVGGNIDDAANDGISLQG